MFGPVIRDYHRALVEEIAQRVGLTWTQRQAIPAHFTLKYWFSAPPDGETERVLDTFGATHARTPVRVGGLGHFDRDVLFVEVTLSEPARRTLGELLAILRALPWMSWDVCDGDNLHPHMTIAERCGDRFDQAWTLAALRQQSFEAELDNITMFRHDGDRDGVPIQTLHRTFLLGRCPEPEVR